MIGFLNALFGRALNRLRVVLERDAEESDARIERTWPVARVRQLYERDVLAQREGAAVGNDR